MQPPLHSHPPLHWLRLSFITQRCSGPGGRRLSQQVRATIAAAHAWGFKVRVWHEIGGDGRQTHSRQQQTQSSG
ncbi:hypothetical protein GX408_20035 [bacterium]|nr:hypothetical protein [bacterium]